MLDVPEKVVTAKQKAERCGLDEKLKLPLYFSLPLSPAGEKLYAEIWNRFQEAQP
jgi:hypothetical protein